MEEIVKWKNFFIEGEYPNRANILSGLKIEDVIFRPENIKNSIYDELWHMEKWQNKIVLNDDEADADLEYEKWKNVSARFPQSDPKSQKEWDSLVESFLSGLDKILECCKSPDILSRSDGSGFTMRDALYFLAMHNAYHFGKIISIRQYLGLWPLQDIEI